jgi:hypothetical protein
VLTSHFLRPPEGIATPVGEMVAVKERWTEGEHAARPAIPIHWPARFTEGEQHALVPMLLRTEVRFAGDENYHLRPETPPMRPLVFAALFGYVDIAKIALRRGAQLETPVSAEVEAKLEVSGTPLLVACQGVERGVPMDCLGIATFLLEVGADANARARVGGATALHVACEAQSLELCEALLRHGADPDAVDARGRTPAHALQSKTIRTRFARLVAAARGTARPERLCGCGSALAFTACHGQPRGVPLSPCTLCPCERNARLLAQPADARPRERPPELQSYGRCCLRRGVHYRETLTHAISPPRFFESSHAAEFQAATTQMQMPTLSQSGATAMIDVGRTLTAQLAAPLVAAGQVDAAFVAVIEHGGLDWLSPRAWASLGLSKQERRNRMAEWNGAVDAYTRGELRCARDVRPAEAICQAIKIDAQGCALYKRCAGCGRGSSAEDLKLCSGCRAAHFCGPACVKAGWPAHKPTCRGPPTLTHGVANALWLPSSLTLALAFDSFSPTVLPQFAADTFDDPRHRALFDELARAQPGMPRS